MEFYVKLEFRRMGYGKAMFRHLERLFESHGTKRMYLTADPVTGKPFWESLGFAATGEVSPENRQMIYEKDVQSSKELITVRFSKYLTNDLAEKIAMAQWHTNAPEWINRIREATYTDNYFYDSFCVIACNPDNDIVGRLYCIQNEDDKTLWYYGDLFVIKEYRRMGIASQMINTAVNHLSEISAKKFRCYVEPDNTASIALQKSIGFHEMPYKTFNDLNNDGQIMFEYEFPCPYSIIRATVKESRFVICFYRQNENVLHGGQISNDNFKAMLSSEDKDEQNFLVCRGCMPVAWLKINGLSGKETAWISMLVVSDKHQRQGIGRFAVCYTEQFAKEREFSKIAIHTTEDNISAQNLYKKCGYIITEKSECTTGDGVKRTEYTFMKRI